MTTKLKTLQLMLDRATASDSPYVAEMKSTFEDSPWHREASVWVHTQMVVGEYLKIWEEFDCPDDYDMFLGGVAALFHDFGKPEAEEERTTEERGTYRRYKGHEAVSAGCFREVATSEARWAELFGDVPLDLAPEDVYSVALMVQHHLPYQYKQELVHQVLLSLEHSMGTWNPFVQLLRADARGRTSDDHEKKLADMEAWIKQYVLDNPPFDAVTDCDANVKLAYVLVGPSGAGKGTYVNEALKVDRAVVYSQDDLRLEHYGDPSEPNALKHYMDAWQAAADDGTKFAQLCTARINQLVRSNEPVVVSDNMNLSKKSRRQFVAAAKQAGRRVVAVVFVTTSVDELIKRGNARGDRGVHPGRLKMFFHSLHMPALDEADVVHLV